MTISKHHNLISVFMPVYNSQEYLTDAIDSILSQTYTNFEFIIIDDASTDNSWKIIKSFANRDKRIRAYRNKINLGVSISSNIAISLARGKFLARMDSDDISVSDRLQKQLDYLKRNPKTIIVGGQCTIIDENGQITGYKNFPTSESMISDLIFWAVPIQQGYMMINRQLLPKNFSWYLPTKTSAEEVDLFFKLKKYGHFANLKDYLYFYRQLGGSLSHRNPKQTFWLTLQSRLNAIKDGYQPSLLAILINLAQIITISLLPNQFIYSLWYFIRGVSQIRTNIGFSLAKIGIKS